MSEQCCHGRNVLTCERCETENAIGARDEARKALASEVARREAELKYARKVLEYTVGRLHYISSERVTSEIRDIDSTLSGGTPALDAALRRAREEAIKAAAGGKGATT